MDRKEFAVMTALIMVVDLALSLVSIVLFVYVILSWLVQFGIVNPSHSVVRTLWEISRSISDPILAPFRRILPRLGGVDLSPIALILVIYFLRSFIRYDLPGLLG
jgi:YggT family protein